MTYLLCFAASAILIALAQKRKTTAQFAILSAAALFLPCLLAGLRAEIVGTDVLHYLKPMTENAIQASGIGAYFQSGWESSLGYLHVTDFEYGFTVLIYLLAKLTGNLQMVQFLLEALILLPVYIALARNRKTLPVWLGMLVFYLLFYIGTLNLMRQWMAMSLLILAFQMLREKKLLPGILLSAAALLFHYSSALVLVVYAVWIILQLLGKVKSKKAIPIGAALICIVGFVVVFNAHWIPRLLSALGIHRFDSYLQGEKPAFVLRELLLRLPLLLVFALHWKKFRQKTPEAWFYITLLVLDVAASQLVSVNPYTYRIGLFFAMYAVFAVPSLYASLKTPLQKGLTATAVIIYLLCYWGYLYTVLFLHQAYPYLFFWQSW